MSCLPPDFLLPISGLEAASGTTARRTTDARRSPCAKWRRGAQPVLSHVGSQMRLPFRRARRCVPLPIVACGRLVGGSVLDMGTGRGTRKAVGRHAREKQKSPHQQLGSVRPRSMMDPNNSITR